MTAKTASALIIGNEILSGRTQDSNLGHLGKKLMGKGVRLMHARVLPDIEDEIVRHLNECRAVHDYVFTSGGIGPTHDDITSAGVAKAFGVPLVLNAEARARLTRHYGGEDQLNPGRLRMATLPQGAVLIDNPISTAPGFRLGNVFVLAGVPKIMQSMLDSVLPQLAGGPPILSRTIGCLIPESVIADGLRSIAASYPDLEIGSYPYFRMTGYGLSLVLRGTDPARLGPAAEELCALIRSLGGDPVRLDSESAVQAPHTAAQ